MDEDWDAVCETVYKRIERSGWEGLYCDFVDVNDEVNVPPSKWRQQGHDLVEGKLCQGKRRRVP